MEDTRKIVVITDLRTKEAQDACGYLADLGYDVRPVPEEICLWDEDALRAWVTPFGAEVKGVIHPAPPFVHGGIEEVTEEQWDKNAYEGPVAALIVTKVFGMLFRENGGGAIIYLNSIHAEKPAGKGLLYSMACGAVQMLNRDFNQDYGEFNVNTYFVQRGPSAEDEQDHRSDVSPLYFGVDLRYPQRRYPEEGYLNGILAFLLTDAAAPLAGSDVRADGGYVGYYGHRRKVEGRAYAERKRD